MIKLKDILYESQNNLNTKKGEYKQITNKSELEVLSKELYDLVTTAYKPIGGHHKITKPQDILRADIQFWSAADVDEDPQVDVTVFGKQTPYGSKLTGIGHDGDKENIKNLLKKQSDSLKSPGTYAEVSGDAFRTFVEKGGVPVVEDESLVRKILKHYDIEWHGKHPNDSTKKGNGWYTRKLGSGKPSTKTLIGIPRK